MRALRVGALVLAVIVLPAVAGAQLLWFGDGQSAAQARRAIALLEDAASHGLDPRDYDTERLAQAVQNALMGPQPIPEPARSYLDTALTDAMQRYLSDLQVGRVRPSQVHANFTPTRRSVTDLATALRSAVAEQRLDQAVQQIATQLPMSDALRRALAYYRRLEGDNDWRAALPAPGGGKLVAGQAYAGLAELARRLRLLGDLAEGPVPDIIVGKALDTRTPLFDEDMRYIEFSPYWNVPRSIATKELVPQLRDDPAHFTDQGLEFVTDARAAVQTLTPAHLDAVMQGSWRIRQRPGPKNALGDIKFIFPNNANIYLHHTPAIGLFDRARRDLSHGCIRIEDPVALARFVLQDDPLWTEESIRAAMQAGKSSMIGLQQPLPVLIAYSTVVVQGGADPFLPGLVRARRPARPRVAGTLQCAGTRAPICHGRQLTQRVSRSWP